MTITDMLGQLGARAVATISRACDWIEPVLPPDSALVRCSLIAWLICLGCLVPAVWRIARGRQRNLDPIWGLVALLALNRLSFLLHVSPEVSHFTAIVLALSMAALTISYQRWDERISA